MCAADDQARADGEGRRAARARSSHADRCRGGAHARGRLPSAEDAARLASLLSIMADPVRRRFLYALDISEHLCVGDLALALGAWCCTG